MGSLPTIKLNPNFGNWKNNFQFILSIISLTFSMCKSKKKNLTICHLFDHAKNVQQFQLLMIRWISIGQAINTEDPRKVH